VADLTQLVDRVVSTDVLVVGSEGAGARAAIEAFDRGASVLVVSKGVTGHSGATVTADADIDVDSRSCRELLGLPGDMDDSPEKFMEDMIIEGEYLGDQRLIEIHCLEAPLRTKQLVDWGARIDKLTHAPGHRYPRGVWIPGDEFCKAFRKEIAKRDIGLIEHMMIVDLLRTDGQVVGALGVNMLEGTLYAFEAKAVILCTGGAMRVYPHTTAPDELTGDGLAMAYRAGAELVEMEFPMFMPYALIGTQAADGIDFPYLLSAYLSARALNRLGERYMERWDPERLERTTRDVNSIAAAIEVLEGRGSPAGGTYLSLKHLPQNLVDFASEWLPESMANWHYGGFDIRQFIPDPVGEAMETAPASHFWNGGIRINERCETTVPGLYAAGEGTGSIHGANRVSGNALTMTQVWGPRAGEFAAKHAASTSVRPIDLDQVAALRDKIVQGLDRKKGTSAIKLRQHISTLAADKVGVVRDEPGLQEALSEIAALRQDWGDRAIQCKERVFNLEWVEALQDENLLDVLEMVARSSLKRTESRGALYRRDHTKTNNVDWIQHIVIQKVDGKMALRTEPVATPRLKPRPEIRDYGVKE
jgi:succinate dehydrogenase / fumarate reductase flavoprotein subunit/fumarate reductase (CoM/CoB) subunit A